MITNARKSDPKSSYIAGAIMETSGRAATHRAMVLELVRNNPDLTSKELAIKNQSPELDRHEIAR